MLATIGFFTVTSLSIEAATVAWWRIDGSGEGVLRNSASTGALFDATMPSGSALVEESNAPYVVTQDGATYANAYSYAKGTATTGAQLNNSASATLAALFAQSEFTIEAEIRATESGLNYTSILTGLTSGPNPAWFNFGTASDSMLAFNASDYWDNQLQVSASPLPQGEWLHFAAVGTREQRGENIVLTVQLFVNGVAIGDSQEFWDGIKEGSDYNFNVGLFPGYVSQLRISDEALATSEFLTFSPIPEPGTLSFLTVPLLLAGIRRIRKRVA